MSGGSFDYLCELPVSDIDSRHIDTLQAMAEQLEEIAWGHPATRATRDHVERLKAAVDPYADLRPVWRAVEWWKSSDCSREQVEEALDKYEAAIGKPATVKHHVSYAFDPGAIPPDDVMDRIIKEHMRRMGGWT